WWSHPREARDSNGGARGGNRVPPTLLCGAPLGHGLEPLPDLLSTLPEIVQARQLRQPVEPEDPLEKLSRPVAHGPRRSGLSPGLGNEASLDEPADARIGGDAADPGDGGPRAGPEVGDHRERLQRGLREASLDRTLDETCAGRGVLARGAERIAAGHALQHDPAPSFAESLA